PPLSITPMAANCDAPVNTSRDITHAWAGVSPAATASTPKEIPKTATAMPSMMLAVTGFGAVDSVPSESPGSDGTGRGPDADMATRRYRPDEIGFEAVSFRRVDWRDRAR